MFMKVLEEQSGFTTLQAFITRTKKNLMPMLEKNKALWSSYKKSYFYLYCSIFNRIFHF